MESPAIQRHKTAIRRGDFSRPVKCLLRDGLIGKEVTFFDYGCGRGEDLELLAAEGIACSGWDPAYQPEAPRQEADVVNLGYVLNVIEDPEERAATLRTAWGLCRQLLAVSAQVLVAGGGKEPVEFGDGVLTGLGTFQKFYEQSELKTYLETQLQTEAIPAGIGTFYLFKDETRRQQFLANRHDAHPTLLRCVKLNLRTRQIECYDYAQSASPPVLHRKESFLLPTDPWHDTFARLTALEEKHGLLDDPARIGTRLGWAQRLQERGFCLKGHRLGHATIR
jgi:hypothetical protein